MNKKSNHYTLMFIPENNGKTFTLRVHKNIVRSILTFLLIFIICLAMLLYKSGEIAAKLQMLYILRIENEKLVTENNQLKKISNKFVKIESLYSYLNKLANPPSMVKTKTDNNTLTENTEEVVTNEIANKLAFNAAVDQKEINSIPDIMPVDGWITRNFLKSKDTNTYPNIHLGVDFAATLGTPIKATAAGTVEDIQNDPYLGLLITIRHDNEFVTKYGHCSQVLIVKHDGVRKGQAIALVGNTGRSTAPHLHYELLKDGVNIDPLKYLLTYK